MGRLFDAVSALIGIRQVIQYEAQAACEMEAAARRCRENTERTYPFTISDRQGIFTIEVAAMFEAISGDLRNGADTATIARTFHSTIARIVCDTCVKIRNTTGIRNVALSGGVFQNRMLLRDVIPLLEQEGFSVLTHHRVPCNDGGISLGQAVIANFAR